MGIVVQDVHVCRLMCIVEFTADSGIDLTDAKIRLNIDPKDNLRNRQKGKMSIDLKTKKSANVFTVFKHFAWHHKLHNQNSEYCDYFK